MDTPLLLQKFLLNKFKIQASNIMNVLKKDIPICQYIWPGIGDKTITYSITEGLYTVTAFEVFVYIGKDIFEAVEAYNEADVDIIGKPISELVSNK